MRTKSLCLAAAALAAGVLTSSAQSNVYSLNIVGYVNTVFKGGGAYTLVANPLNAPTNDLNSILAPSLPNKSTVTTYDGVNYNTYGKAGGVWPSNVFLPPGTGFFVKNVGAGDITNTFVGDVLTGIPGTNTVAIPAGYSLVGSPLPVGGDINSSGPNTLNLSPALPNKAQVVVYDNSTTPGTYLTYGKAGGVFPAATISVGQGFYIKALTAGSNWVQTLQ